MQHVIQFLAIAICCMLLLNACAKEDNPVAPPPANIPDTPSFANNVLPIFQQHGCTGCHGGQNNLFVETVAGLLRGGDHGPAVRPGNADSSLIIRKTSASPPFGARMPLGATPLTDTETQIIRKWINQGARNN